MKEKSCWIPNDARVAIENLFENEATIKSIASEGGYTIYGPIDPDDENKHPTLDLTPQEISKRKKAEWIHYLVIAPSVLPKRG